MLFFFSGASSLVFEITFTRLLAYTFGNTAYAVSTVLAAFLGGLALGAAWIGRWADRRGASLRTYGTLELLVGVYCLFAPEWFAVVTRAYVGLYHLLPWQPWLVTVIRFGLASVVILVPTMLMGGTLPVLARCAAAATGDFQVFIDRLYAWNTLGAALGTLAATYFLVLALGVRGTIAAASAVNGAIFLVAVTWTSQKPSLTAPGSGTTPAGASHDSSGKTNAARDALLLPAAFLTGMAALAYEVVWTHILSFLIGNTVYAFGIMLFTFLCGLGMGAHLVARHMRRATLWARALAASQLLLGLAVFVTMPLWNYIPALFAEGLRQALALDLVGCAFLLALRMAWIGWRFYRQSGGSRIRWRSAVELVVEGALLLFLVSGKISSVPSSEVSRFVVAEGLRFFCAFYLLIVPCLLAGLSFPLLLNLAAASEARVGSAVGRTYAANTLGTVLGSVLMGFVLLPALGSLASLRAVASLNLLLGWGLALLFVPLERARRLILTLVAWSLAALFWLGPVNWDPRTMTSGTYVYFSHTWDIRQVLDVREDVQGGLTSVVQTPVGRMLLSNGKFQGNDSGEVGAQARFAIIPILFTSRFDRALVIGLGTGQTLQVVSRFPFRRIEVAEIAPSIVAAARAWFEDVNGRVFDHDPRVKLTIADGRNYLLLSREPYDLITIEITSIWVSGSADLYNREFYELCRSRLAKRGVLQQWVQLHHMRTRDLLVLLNTAARVFPHVAFFVGEGQGLLIASPGPLEFDWARIAALDAEPGVRQELGKLELGSLSSLLGEVMLYEQSFRQMLTLLPSRAGLSPDFVSSDSHPYLEYATPLGNTAPYNTLRMNMQVLGQFRPPLIPPDLPIRNLASEDEANLLAGFVAEGREEWKTARDYFLKVHGPARGRAEAELDRIAKGSFGESP